MMKIVLKSLVVFCLVHNVAMAQLFEQRAVTVSNVNITVSSLGLIGNAFAGIYRQGAGSAEWPRGEKIEHCFQGGLWVGGFRDGQPVVMTSYLDNPSGYACNVSGYELTPVSNGFSSRSSLPTSPNFDPRNAISHEDLLARATDVNRFCLDDNGQPTGNEVGNGHTPLGLEIGIKFYNWSFSFADYFMIGDFTVKNVGTNTIDSVYVGYLTNGVVRNTNLTPAGSGGSNYFNKGGNGFLKDYSMSYDWDATGEPNATGTYFGQKFLGASDKNGSLKVGEGNFNINFNTWIFQATSGSACYLFPGRGDGAKASSYERMTLGLEDNPCWDALPAGASCGCGGNASSRTRTLQEEIGLAGNRSNLISVGPYATLAPGDSITFTIGFLFANQTNLPQNRSTNPDNDSTRVELIAKAEALQTLFDNDYILPEPPPTPFVFYTPTDSKIVVEWADNAENVPDPQTGELDFEGYRIYLSRLGFDVAGQQTAQFEDEAIRSNLNLHASFDLPNNAIYFDNGFDKIRLDDPYQKTIEVAGKDSVVTIRYRYEIENLNNGWQYAVALTSFDRGSESIASLESNPNTTQKRLFPGTSVNADLKSNEPFVYPNPYYAGASWEGSSVFGAETRKIYFANLPDNCVIKVFTPSGDLIKTLQHTKDYAGEGSLWYNQFAGGGTQVQKSGGEHAWNLLSNDFQIMSRGIYVFTIEQQDKIVYKGNFAVIK